jgi:hypothetical protein
LKDVGDVDLRVQWAGGFSKGQNRQLFRVSGSARRRHTTNSKSGQRAAGLGWAGGHASYLYARQSPASVCQCGPSCLALNLVCTCFGGSLSAQIEKTCHRAGGPFFFPSPLGMITSKPSQDHRAALSTSLAPPKLPGRTMRPWARYPWPELA